MFLHGVHFEIQDGGYKEKINCWLSSFTRIYILVYTAIPIAIIFARFVYITDLDPYSAGIDFRRQNLTSTDVRFWGLNSIPALWKLNYFYWPYTHTIGIQMSQKELAMTVMMISNRKKTH